MSKTKLFYRMNPATGRVRGVATNTIGEGGNFVARKRDVRNLSRVLSGKATNGSSITLVERKNQKRNFVRLSADPVTGSPSRSELAITKNFEFGERVKINMEFKIKASRLDQLTGYVLQFWQPVISPIAGIRVSGGRLEAVSRTGGGAASKRLTKGWNNLEIIFTAGRNGELSVSGDLNGSVRGNIDGGSQASRAVADTFRPKFGWYGSLNQEAEVRYRSFELEAL